MPTLTTLTTLTAFALIALGMVLTPGPNMIYLISRSITQGPRAGLVSLTGVATGFVVYMVCAALGITTIVIAIPYAYDVLKFGGAAYLLYLAWQAIKPGGSSPFQLKDLSIDGDFRLFAMGLFTNLLNPKIAVMYLSLLPQFIDAHRPDVLTQALALGTTQILVSLTVNTLIVLSAGSIALFLAKRPVWVMVQKWLMATVLGALAVKMATEARH